MGKLLLLTAMIASLTHVFYKYFNHSKVSPKDDKRRALL